MAKKKNVVTIKVVGCGGIGTSLIDDLCRYLNYTDHEVVIDLIDGDFYEERNRERQVFDDYGPKAIVTAERLQKQFQRITINAHPIYLDNKNIGKIIQDGDIVLSCVDNHKTRKLISDCVKKLRNTTFVSGGNDYTDGNVIVHIRKNGKDLTPPIETWQPAIANPLDKNPADEQHERKGCQVMVQAAPQLLFANRRAATHMLECLYQLLQGKLEVPFYSDIYFDILTGGTRSSLRPHKQVDKKANVKAATKVLSNLDKSKSKPKSKKKVKAKK